MKRFVLLIGILFFSNVFAYTDLSAEQFKKMIKEKDVVILDVRTPEEYEKDGHIKGANLIPVQLFRYIYLPGLRDKKVLVYCRSGNRSVTASRMLEQMGIKNVYNLKGGIIEWKSKKLPVEYGWK
ncbi:rhodanese-like domain-containing protein [Persephonella sp.]|uniref:rhodanese-like domain-containing protein n=1 Tax=Persephonella sp. TaxID=2060922 RepID=UPI0025E0D8A7|nr:rhodanese-like domain-containing protein [Persephonella sp.]